MRQFSRSQQDGWQRFQIAGGQHYRSPGVVHVEGDASSASYFLAAGAIGKRPVRGRRWQNSIQGDVRFVETLQQMGAHITIGDKLDRSIWYRQTECT